MTKKIGVLLVSSSEDFTAVLAARINEQENMAVLATAGDGEEALALVRKLQPQVVITDILLRRLDGVGFIRALRNSGSMPQTIVVSAFLNDAIAAEIGALGVSYCFHKPCRISELISRIHDCAHPERNGPAPHSYEPEVTDALISFGVMPHLQGFRFLREAICLNLATRGDAVKSITKNLYPDLGKAFHTNRKCVERSMRNALDTAWDHLDAKERDARFGELTAHLTRRPSNSQFIALITEYILRNEHERRDGIA